MCSQRHEGNPSRRVCTLEHQFTPTHNPDRDYAAKIHLGPPPRPANHLCSECCRYVPLFFRLANLSDISCTSDVLHFLFHKHTSAHDGQCVASEATDCSSGLVRVLCEKVAARGVFLAAFVYVSNKTSWKRMYAAWGCISVFHSSINSQFTHYKNRI
jgi:hypothetical protein